MSETGAVSETDAGNEPGVVNEARTRGEAGDAGEPADETSSRSCAGRARLPSGWYVLGLALQVFLWFLVFLGLAIAIGVGGHLTEFRYVGF